MSKYLDDEFVVSELVPQKVSKRNNIATIVSAVCIWPRRLARVGVEGVGSEMCIRGKTVNKQTYIK